MPPVDFITLAAGLKCRQIGLAVQPVVLDKKNYAEWSLKTDAPLLRDVKAALKDHGVSIAVGEGFLFQPGADPSSHEADMDILRDLGAARVNALTFDTDFNRGWRPVRQICRTGTTTRPESRGGIRAGHAHTATCRQH